MSTQSDTRCEFVLEIGAEEMPSAPLICATKQLAQIMERELKACGLAYSSLEAHNSPRRLVVLVHGLAAATQEKHTTKRGPAVSIAYDAQGNLTKAGLGFARKAGATPEQLSKKQDKDGKEYIWCDIFTPSLSAHDLLGDIITNCITKLEWPNYRSQRWGTTTESFVRPVRWICALLNDDVIPCTFADVTSSNYTLGHRVLAPGKHVVSSASAYLDVLHDAHVMLEDERRQRILDDVAAYEKAHPGMHVDMPRGTFDEVVNLTEWPHVVIGEFDHQFLAIPHEIICESMLTNQRYFPIYDADGALTCFFVIVSNAKPEMDTHVIDGNERVVRARLSDAQFFYTEDLKAPLESYVPLLKRVTFQEKLGSVFQKAVRMRDLAQTIAEACNFDAALTEHCARAAYLAKADLVTQTVVEFTSQQGVMGAYFAEACGEDPDVVAAIKEHYHPRFSGDSVAQSTCGKVVSLADKLDTICGMFAIDQPPTGSSDPFALRRSALGCIAILKELPAISLLPLITASLALYDQQGIRCDADATIHEISQFFLGRLGSLAKDEHVSPEVVMAISAISIIDPQEFFARAHALEQVQQQQADVFEDLAIAYGRADHIRKAELGTAVDVDMLAPTEQKLYHACLEGQDNVEKALSNRDYVVAASALAALRLPIDEFFDDIRVMDDDTKIRNNRLRLLNLFCSVFTNVADISVLTHH